MPGVDELISKSLSDVIKKNLEPHIEKKVKMKLFKKYGLSIQQAIKDFSKLDNVLTEFLKTETLNFEKKCLMDVISIKYSKNLCLVTIKNQNLIGTFFEILGDKEYRKIIESTISKPLLISEIIEQKKLPKTSGYRKINYLIRNGFLMGVKKEYTNKRRSVNRLIPIFEKLVLELNQNQSILKITVPKKIIEQSTSIQKIQKN